MKLKKYRQKRTFETSPEPDVRRPAKGSKKPLEFCVQKHAARRLHYDFRLEHEGVLLSWAIPKGPSTNPSDKRLAIRVEDHPFEYRTFEGTIPKGEYGAGTVEIWDKGTYAVPGATSRAEAEKRIAADLKKGHLEFELHGRRLQGAFVLVKLNTDDKSWLLIKMKGDHVDPKVSLEDEEKDLSKIPKKKIPHGLKAMLATLVEKPFSSPEWLFEIKWDGYRALAYIEKNQVELRSRSDNLFNPLFPALVEELKHLNIKAIIDGEIVVLDKEGRSHFQLMQNYQRTRNGALYYYAFDLLYLEGHDLRDLPLIERKKHLKELLKMKARSLSLVRYSDHVEENGESLFKEATRRHLEGIIGKKIDSAYISKRSREWVKIKTHLRQEAVIGGFTAPRGARKKFGALLLGVYQNDQLIYIGHAGGGFDSKLLDDVYSQMEPLIQKECPFKKTPKPNAPVTWVKPKLVCEVIFSEWTNEGIIRQPVFQGLRMDKKAKEVKKEVPELAPLSNETTTNFSNLDKIYWPKEKYTKGDLIQYYQQVASHLLPYLKNRPIMLHRYPEGIAEESFYQKDTKNLHLPESVETVSIQHEGKNLEYILVQDRATLEYVINLGTIEIHPFLSQADSLQNPDYLLIDLDPVEISFDKVVETALAIHDLLEEVKVKNFCKTSGGRGLHICIPLQKKYDFEQAKQFGEIIVGLVHQRMPEITSLERKPSKREKKVYLDVYQNNFGQTMVAPYSVRGRPHAPVSTPLKWDEVKKGLDPIDWNIKTVPNRLKKVKDPFKPVLGAGIHLEVVLKKLEKLSK